MQTASTTTSSTATRGYHGRYLRVDVGDGRAEPIALEEQTLRHFVGGSGLGTWLLLREGLASVDPLSPAAPLAFVFSPLVGSPLTTSAKFAVVAKSPLSERINDSLAGGRFAIAGKQTGCDAIVVVGRASQPSVLIIDDGRVRLEPAGALWGNTGDKTEADLRQRLGVGYEIATIGPAGEQQVRFATISHAGRYAARGGHGAVLGAKNLKAVAVRGSQHCRLAHPRRLLVLAEKLSRESVGPATAKYRELGTASNLLLFNRLHTLPTRNFQQGSFAGAERLSPENLARVREKTRTGCAVCTVGCEHLYTTGGGGDKGGRVRLEYENLFALGPLCGIDDPNVVLEACRLCNALGMDAISTGGTVAFAMECVERRLLDADWLQFGKGDALLRAITEIAHRQGIGQMMAEGSRRMALAIGHDSLAFAPQVKGLELPGYEPRSLQTMALGFAVGARGADHNRSGAYEVDISEKVDRRHVGPEAATLAIETEDQAALMDSLILCKFLRGLFTDFFAATSEMVNLIAGWNTSADELRTVARRIVTAKKHYNILAGWQPEEDILPDRFLNNPLPDDPAAVLSRETLAAMVRTYNLNRGWTEEGWIEPALLEHFGLGERPMNHSPTF